MADAEIDALVKQFYDDLLTSKKATFKTAGTASKQNTTKVLDKLMNQLEWVVLSDGSVQHKQELKLDKSVSVPTPTTFHEITVDAPPSY